MNSFLIGIATTLLAIPASAQTAVIERTSCGTGCGVAIKQLSAPEQLNDHWAVVKVQKTVEMYSRGKPLKEWRGMKLPSVSTGYKFANCQQGLFADSPTREVPVNYIRNVLALDGSKKTASVYGFVYDQWVALCQAIKQ